MLDIDMSYLKYNRGTLLSCWYRMFQFFELIEKFKINPLNLQRFLTEICRKYKRVPFHNMTHAFNVTHTCFYIILQMKKEPVEDTNEDEESFNQGVKKSKSLIKESIFTDLDILAMILACIGHDLDHPGLGNTYFMKAKEVRATSVNNTSILENYHNYMLM